jgi:hypothetical protein
MPTKIKGLQGFNLFSIYNLKISLHVFWCGEIISMGSIHGWGTKKGKKNLRTFLNYFLPITLT